MVISVEKYGCPVPPAKNTTFPLFKSATASSFEKSFVHVPQAKGVYTLVSIPSVLKISDTYIQFIIVANIPIPSALGVLLCPQ